MYYKYFIKNCSTCDQEHELIRIDVVPQGQAVYRYTCPNKNEEVSFTASSSWKPVEDVSDKSISTIPAGQFNEVHKATKADLIYNISVWRRVPNVENLCAWVGIIDTKPPEQFDIYQDYEVPDAISKKLQQLHTGVRFEQKISIISVTFSPPT